MHKKIIIIAFILLFTSFAGLSFAKGGGGAGGAGSGRSGSSGQGNHGSNIGVGNDNSKSDINKNNFGKPKRSNNDVINNFFEKFADTVKGLDAFQVNEEEEKKLIENSWND